MVDDVEDGASFAQSRQRSWLLWTRSRESLFEIISDLLTQGLFYFFQLKLKNKGFEFCYKVKN